MTLKEQESGKINEREAEHVLSGQHTEIYPFPTVETQVSELGHHPPIPQCVKPATSRVHTSSGDRLGNAFGEKG
jgi:hypothetical protein